MYTMYITQQSLPGGGARAFGAPPPPPALLPMVYYMSTYSIIHIYLTNLPLPYKPLYYDFWDLAL